MRYYLKVGVGICYDGCESKSDQACAASAGLSNLNDYLGQKTILGIFLGRLKTLKHSKIITCIPYTYHLHIIYIGRDRYISVRGHQIDLWFQNLPIFREERVQVCDQKCSTWVKQIQNPNVCNAMIATRQRRLPLLSLSVGRRPLVRLEGGLDALH